MMLLTTRAWEPMPSVARRAAFRALALLLVAAPLGAPLAAQAPVSGRPTRALSLADAVQLAERQSEGVRVAEAGVLRARGQFAQARSQLLPQINATGAYQKQLQSQFQQIQNANPAPVTQPTDPVALCAPNIPANATPEVRAEALARAQSCSQGGGDGFGSITQIFANPNNIILGLTGSQNLFTGGRVVAGVRAAEAGRRSADIGVRSARAQVTLDVAQAYFDAALAQRLVTISESSLVQTERAFRQTAIGREVGNISEFDLLRARVSRDNQRPVLIQARAQRDISLVRLRQLLDLPLDEPLQLTTALPVPPAAAADALRTAAGTPPAAPAAPGQPAVSVAVNDGERFTTVAVDPAEVLGIDPLVTSAVDSVVSATDTTAGARAPARQTRENITAQRNLLRSARAQRLPALQLSSNYQRFAYPSGDGITFPTALNQFFPNWTVTLGVSVPIFNGGRIRGDELIAEANLREAEQTSRQVEELAALDARLAISQLEQAEATWRSSGGTAGQATRAYAIAEVRFREGLATQLELADARLLLQQAEANAATAARDREVARLRLALLPDLPLSQQAAAGTAQQGMGTRTGATGQGSTQQQQRQPQSTQVGAQGAGGFQQTGTTGGTP